MLHLKRQRKTKSIGKYVGLGLIVTALIPVLLMTIASFIMNHNLISNRVHIDEQSATSVVMTAQNNMHKKNILELNRISNQSDFSHKTFDLAGIKTTLGYIKADGDPDIINLGFATTNGDTVMTSSVPTGYDARQRSWFNGALQDPNKVYVTPAYKDPLSGRMVTSYSKVIINAGNQSGVLMITVPYDSISNILKSIKVSRTGSATLITSTGLVLASQGKDKQITYREGTNLSDQDVYKKIAADSRLRGNLMIGKGRQKHEIYFDKGRGNSIAWAIAEVSPHELALENESILLISVIVGAIILLLTIVVSWLIVRILQKILGYYTYYFSQAGAGNLLKIRGDETNKGNVLGRVLRNLGYPDKDGHELNRMAAQYNEMIDAISTLIAQVQDSSKHVAQSSADLLELARQTDTATEEVAHTITGIAEVAGSQARDTEISVNQVQNLSNVVKELRTNIITMNEQAGTSATLNKQNLATTMDVNDNWNKQLEQMQALMIGMDDMNQNIQAINQIIKVINDISQQTNLLALNASIEAASAGDAGNGFAVVAAEIRKLAEESKVATKDIASIIEKIRSKSATMVTQTESSVNGGQKQTELIKQAITSTEEVFKKNTELVMGIEQIESASAQIESIQHEVLTSLESISASTEENSAGTEEVSANAEEVLATMDEFTSNVEKLRDVAKQMDQASHQFVLDEIIDVADTKLSPRQSK